MGIVEALAAFTLAAALLTATPGLDTALVLRTAAVEGARPAWLAAIGIGGGCVAWGMLVAVGLGALLASAPQLYEGLRLAGALYLVWLGLGMLRRAFAYRAPEAAAPLPATGQRWLARGFLNNLLNPKVGLFYLSFLPQFVPQGVPAAPWMVLLALIHFALGLVWAGFLIAGTDRARAFLSHPRAAVWLDGATGGLFVAAGTFMIVSARR